MARAEDLFQASKKALESKSVTLRNRIISLNWFDHPVITPLMNEQAPKVFEDAPNTLHHSNLKEAACKILSQEENIISTVNSLFAGKNPEISDINTIAIQMGRKAYILLCQVETSAGNGNFAIYLGRNANSSEFGHEAERDFHNLKDLNEAAEQKLTDKAKKKYKFLRPMTLINPIEVNGNEYSSFTMPFIDNYGELRAGLYEGKQTDMAFPFFRYSVSFTRKMEEFNEIVFKRNQKIENTFVHLLKRFPDRPLEYVLKQLHRIPEFQIMKKQLEDLLIGNALIYLLSDGHFPKEFMINAGDWMVNFIDDSIYLYLITIRGGWEKLSGDEGWKERMRKQEEPVPGREMEGIAMPVFYAQDDVITTALEKAKKLLKN
jgi:hypothetical protein